MEFQKSLLNNSEYALLLIDELQGMIESMEPIILNEVGSRVLDKEKQMWAQMGATAAMSTVREMLRYLRDTAASNALRSNRGNEA